MFLTEEEKVALIRLHNSNCNESIIEAIPVKVVKSLTNRGIIESLFYEGGSVVDIRIPPKTKEFIKDNLL